MCNIISEYFTTMQPITVYKLCRFENDTELRSEFLPGRRVASFNHPGEDILYRHICDIGKRLLITDEAPGFCVYEHRADIKERHISYQQPVLPCTIPVGASICRIEIQPSILNIPAIMGYATNMLEIDCNAPWLNSI